MPRYRRHVSPNALIHIIARFLNHEYLLNSPEERKDYLRRVAKCFGDNDWSLLAHALMSSHTHVAAIAGKTPFGPISRSLHSGYATWLNHRRGRLGPAMSGFATNGEEDAFDEYVNLSASRGESLEIDDCSQSPECGRSAQPGESSSLAVIPSCACR